MLQIPGATSYIGSIGKDKFGEEMKKNSKLAGVNVCLGTLFNLLMIWNYLLQMYMINIKSNVFRYNIMRMKLLPLVHVQSVL